MPFIGIEPAIKPAAINSKTQKIGILATKGTLNSELFYKNVEQFQEIQIIEQIGYGLVELIEKGQINSAEMNELLKKYLAPMVDSNIDYLVLGCSHYPYLIPQIKKLIPNKITIIDSGQAVAKQTKKILDESVGLNIKAKQSNSIFYTNIDSLVLFEILENKYPVIFKEF